MATVECSCGWSAEDGDETTAWVLWINHDVTAKDTSEHAASAVHQQELE